MALIDADILHFTKITKTDFVLILTFSHAGKYILPYQGNVLTDFPQSARTIAFLATGNCPCYAPINFQRN